MPFGTSLPSPPTLFPIYILPSIPFRRRRRRSSTSTTPPSTSSSPSSSPGTTPPTPSYLSGSTSHLRCSHCLTDLCLTSQIISKGFTGRHGRAYLVSPSSPSSSSSSSPSSSPRTKNKNGGNNKTLLQDRDINNLPNTHTHKPVPRQLVTGAHTVCDISCALCGKVLGWKYLDAEEEAQKYKVGKYILETKRVCRGVDWENGGGGGAGVADGEGGVGWGAATPAEVMERIGDGDWRGGGKEHKRKDSVRSYDPGNDMYEDEEEGGAAWDDEVEFDSQDEDECEDLFTGVWTPQLARKRRESKGFSN